MTDPGAESPVTAAFADGPALVAYVVAGDPGGVAEPSPGGVEETTEHVRALVEGGAGVIELGLPFSEPIAEGVPIQNGIRRALDAGMTPSRYLDLVADLDVDAPLVCMTYYNLLYQFGRDGAAPRGEATGDPPEPFVAAAADAGVDGLIVPDLPVEESGPLRAACEAHGVDLVFIVAPTTRGDRLDRVVDACSGFVYVQSRLGTTGARTDVSEQTYRSLDRVGETELPKAVGFGVSRAEHARAIVRGGADGVVAGSVFVDLVAERGDRGDAAVEDLAAKAIELKEGVEEALPEPERT